MRNEIVSDISFIVVAKNEEFGISKCLNSLKSMPLIDCEVICVDSGSNDSTLEIMNEFTDSLVGMKVYRCSGYSNSAIARNVGLRSASKDIIFFIDGDIEVNFEFVKKSHDYIKGGICDAITGQLSEIYYDEKYQKEIRRVQDRFGIYEEMNAYYSGGCFIANKSILALVGLWDERMERNQDIDFTLRLSRHGRFIAIPISMGVHHTQEYNHRPMFFLKQRFPMFFGMLIRKNFDRPRTLIALIMKDNRGVFVGILFYISVLMFAVGQIFHFTPLRLFIFIIVSMPFIDIVNCLLLKKNILKRIIQHYIDPVMIAAGILFDHDRGDVTTHVQQVFWSAENNK